MLGLKKGLTLSFQVGHRMLCALIILMITRISLSSRYSRRWTIENLSPCLFIDSLFSLIIFIYVSVTFLYVFYAFCWRDEQVPEKKADDAIHITKIEYQEHETTQAENWPFYLQCKNTIMIDNKHILSPPHIMNTQYFMQF